MRRVGLGAAVVAIGALWLTGTAGAYSWPLRPFDKMHAIRAAFDDPRFHLATNESALSAFHFGVDIAAKDGTRVYAVTPGFVRKYGDHVTVRRPATGRAYGYWHIKPAVHTGQHVRVHQFLGTIMKGWGHVHFAESLNGSYRNPLRKGALTPFRDHTQPVVASVNFIGVNGEALNSGNVHGLVDVEASIYDTPPVAPPSPWNVARLAPALVMWELVRNGAPLINWTLSADFTYSLMPGAAYPYIYAPGTYQNKAHRPGNYLFWVTHGLDTSALPNGSYTLNVLAEDTRWNQGELSLAFTIANSGPQTPTYVLRWAGGYAQ